MRTWEDALNPCGHADVLAERDRALAEQRAVLESVRGTIPPSMPSLFQPGGAAPLTTSYVPDDRPWTHTRIGLIRVKLGLTQDQIAREIGVGQKTYQAWEVGRYKPRQVIHRVRLAELEQMIRERGMV